MTALEYSCRTGSHMWHTATQQACAGLTQQLYVQTILFINPPVLLTNAVPARQLCHEISTRKSGNAIL